MADFDTLQTFVAVVETGGITAAAKRLHRAKSAVSRRLSQLEAELGVPLFVRSTRHIVPTDAAQLYYERCVRILADLAEADAAVRGDSTLSGRLRVTLPLAFGMRRVAPVALAYREAHPGVLLDLDVTDRRVDIVAEGFDVAIRVGDLPDTSLRARKLTVGRHQVAASPALLEAHGVPTSPEDLVRYPFLSPARPGFRGPTWQTESGPQDLRPPIAMQSNASAMLVWAAEQDVGLMQAPDFILADAFERGSLTEVLPSVDWGTYTVWAVFPPSRHVARRTRAFVDMVAAALA